MQRMYAERLVLNAIRGALRQSMGICRENIVVCVADTGVRGKKTVVSAKKTMVFKVVVMVFAADTTDIAGSIMFDRKKTMVSGRNTMVCAIAIMVFAAGTADFAADTMRSGKNTAVAGAGTMVSRGNTMVEEPKTMVSGKNIMVSEPETMVFFLRTMRPAPATTIFFLANVMIDVEIVVSTLETSIRKTIQGRFAASHTAIIAKHPRHAGNHPIGLHATATRRRRMTAPASVHVEDPRPFHDTSPLLASRLRRMGNSMPATTLPDAFRGITRWSSGYC